VLTGAGSEDVVPGELGRVLNAAVVGLVGHNSQELGLSGDSGLFSGSEGAETGTANASATGVPYIQGRAPPFPAMSTCFGLALVRSTMTSSAPSDALDGEKQSQCQMHIVTPLPPQYLACSRVLVKGEMELPIWGWLDHRSDEVPGSGVGEVAGMEKGKVPYLQWGKRGMEGAIGQERRRVRRNLMRWGQK